MSFKFQENCTLYAFLHPCPESSFKCRTVRNLDGHRGSCVSIKPTS